ncbi:uncharacterized protein ACN427_009025 isoform 1-T10 [Glossina fuscipes fuscipes]
MSTICRILVLSSTLKLGNRLGFVAIKNKFPFNAILRLNASGRSETKYIVRPESILYDQKSILYDQKVYCTTKKVYCTDKNCSGNSNEKPLNYFGDKCVEVAEPIITIPPPPRITKSSIASRFANEPEGYAECYPGLEEMNDAIDDSDDEVDCTKMDLGNKKGPIGRWDFDTQEEYSDSMST